MSEQQQRPRTVTRLKAEAPPGMGLAPQDGRQAIGRYEILKTLGKGAMGIVYKARDPLLDRIVAVKTISSPQGSGRRVRAAFLERFQREAKAAAKMQHPTIVTIFDVGVEEESGAPYMVLEYLPGESLADRLDRVRFPLHRAVSAASELASALAFAHKQRIVHRDVKPANVLHAGENRWKLADFGIARMPDSDLTQVGIFMGTPGYSPPEAIRDGRYTPQADVFAWGAVLYELVSGRIPYEGPDTKTTNGFVIAGTAQPPSKHDPSIPEPIVKVIMTALEGHADRRYKDGTELENALREAWDRCLTGGLVHPSVLAMDEVPHDRAPAQMHVPKGGAVVAPRPVAPTQELSQFETIDVAPSSSTRFDDEQTTILKRDDMRAMVGGAAPAAHATPQRSSATNLGAPVRGNTIGGGAAPPPRVQPRQAAPTSAPMSPSLAGPGNAGSAPQQLPVAPPSSTRSADSAQPAGMFTPLSNQAVAGAPVVSPGSAPRGSMAIGLLLGLIGLFVASTLAVLYFLGVLRF